ncbi:hypothetical protein [Porphyromonas gulae]|uniref:hypothetical protein n=1 Tax=Porphyromonas gulae TaxID=111105 RepID=UPI001F3F6B86|nr:hypothetical protein [Porphyromonas gulae]
MVGELLVLQQPSAFAVFAVFSFLRSEQIADSVRSLVYALHLGATLVIGTEKIVPRVIVEVNTFTRQEIRLTKQAIAHIPMETHSPFLCVVREDALLRHPSEPVSLGGNSQTKK